MTDRPTYTLVIRPEPGDVPDTVRLRVLLKRLLRVGGMRCIDIRESAPDERTAPPAAGTPDGAPGEPKRATIAGVGGATPSPDLGVSHE